MSPGFMQTFMSRKIVIFSLAFFVLVSATLVVVQYSRSPKSMPGLETNTTPGWTTYTSTPLALSFQYPTGWTIDTTQENYDALTVRETAATTNATAPSGFFGIDRSRTNPDHLSPETWFNTTMLPNIDPPLSATVTTVNTLPAYTVLTNEQSQLRHTFIFSGTKVLEVYFPTDQPKFEATYTAIQDSLQLR